MHTSGLTSAIHDRSGGSLSKYGAQYGSWVRPLSIATPTAGMCDAPTAPTSSAMAACAFLVVRGGAVAVDTAASGEHHLDVLLFAHAGLLGGQLLERHAVTCSELERVVDVAAELEHVEPFALQHCLALFGRERELVEVALLVRSERLAVRLVPQGHAEHVEPVPLATAPAIEHERAGNVVVLVHERNRTTVRSNCERRPFATTNNARVPRSGGAWCQAPAGAPGGGVRGAAPRAGSRPPAPPQSSWI